MEKGRGGILSSLGVSSPPLLSLVESGVGDGGAEWMWVAVFNRCWVEGKKEASAGSWLPAALFGPLSLLLT